MSKKQPESERGATGGASELGATGKASAVPIYLQDLGAGGKASEAQNPLHRKTRKRYDIPGHAHELTFSTNGRRPYLLLSGVADKFVDTLRQTRAEADIEILAYVVMPEHCHILLYAPNGDPKVAEILSRLKMPVSKYAFTAHPHLRQECIKERLNRPPEFNFWLPGGGYDRNIWSPNAVEASIGYIHQNPVKRGLCQCAEEWPWSSASHPIE